MTTFLRAAIMLTVLVGLPAGWIFYDQLPEEARNLIGKVVQQGREKLNWNSGKSAAANSHAVASPLAAKGFGEGSIKEGPALWDPPVDRVNPDVAVQVPPATRTEPPVEQHSAASNDADLEPLLRQLRELGASQYDLQTWGDAEQFYRFQCEMPLSQSSALTQQFEAIASDPHESIAQVVAEVAVWHSDRQIR